MIGDAAATLAADIALAARQEGRIDISSRHGAFAPLESGGELPFADQTVSSLHLGDAVAALSVRDQIQLLIECRRVLVPQGRMLLVEADASTLHARIARWASLVGLAPLPPDHGQPGWTKRGSADSATPLVSIVIPSSNPRYFLECLDSALGQTYPHTEIVICDDSEGDVIEGMLASRAGRSAIRYEKNPQRLRTRQNYEKCLSLARGEYIKFLNDDDVLEPECVSRLLNAFLRVPDLTLATSHRLRIDAQSHMLPDMPATRPIVADDVIVDGVSLANAAIMYGLNFIGEPSTALFRKRDFDRRVHLDGERPFNFNGEEVRGAVDFSMWSRLLVQGNAAFLHDRLSRFRSHGEQAQARPDVVARSIVGIRALQRQWIELGLFRRLPPHLLKVRSLPRTGAVTEAWRMEPVRSLPPSTVPTMEAVRAWRGTRHHPFDFTHPTDS
jgi:glycosyltransferase involved in cell wall biosynthesis